MINSRIHDIQNEHSFYLHNKKGLVLIQNVTMERVGRTCIQSVNRNVESSMPPPGAGAGSGELVTTNSPGIGSLIIDDCQCVDQGIGCEDDHHGGSGYTINGRHWGAVRIRGCRYRAGFDAALKAAIWNKTHDRSSPPFNGALVIDRGQACERSNYIAIADNDFAVAPGCGDRELVLLQGADAIIFTNNTLTRGANHDTVVVDSLSSRNSSLCGFGCRSAGAKGCLRSVDESWMRPGALHYSCNNVASQRTSYRGKVISEMCTDPCCKM